MTTHRPRAGNPRNVGSREELGVAGLFLCLAHPFEKLLQDAPSLRLVETLPPLHVRAQVASVGVLHHEVNPLGALRLWTQVVEDSDQSHDR